MMDPATLQMITRRVFESQTKFEHGTITTVDAQGSATGVTAGRENPRTGLAHATTFDLNSGDRYVSLGSGNLDIPVIFSKSPWVTG